ILLFDAADELAQDARRRRADRSRRGAATHLHGATVLVQGGRKGGRRREHALLEQLEHELGGVLLRAPAACSFVATVVAKKRRTSVHAQTPAAQPCVLLQPAVRLALL